MPSLPMSSALTPVLLLIGSNVFMTTAWYWHLRYKETPLFAVILISWGLAFFEYMFQVPANRAGFKGDGGPFTLVQLKTIQEAITLTVFMLFSIFFFKTDKLGWNHLVGFGLIILAVFVIFKKW